LFVEFHVISKILHYTTGIMHLIFDSPLYKKITMPKGMVTFLVEPRGVLAFALCANYRFNQFLNWLPHYATGIMHLNFDSPLYKKITMPKGMVTFLVEPRGVEPLSENNLTRLSTGVVCYLHSLSEA